jgi:hypothetical protein
MTACLLISSSAGAASGDRSITESYLQRIRDRPRTSPNKQQEIQSAHREALQILTTRLFVTKDIKREGIIQKWEQCLREFQQAKDFHLFGNRCGEMIVTITNLALRDAVV